MGSGCYSPENFLILRNNDIAQVAMRLGFWYWLIGKNSRIRQLLIQFIEFFQAH